jgi:hypothetical protein
MSTLDEQLTLAMLANRQLHMIDNLQRFVFLRRFSGSLAGVEMLAYLSMA